MAARFFKRSSNRALIALAFPLAALVPVAVPFDAAPTGLTTALGQADAATVRKSAKRKAAARGPATTTKLCTTTRIKGRKVTRCKTVKNMPVPPVMVTSIAPVAPLPIAVFAPPAPPPTPMAPQYAPPQSASNAIAYYWIDQADSLAQAFGNSPPDFTFNCDGVDCWAWLSRDGEVLIVEPGRDGVRQYFYAPHQTSPYLVRDSYSSFAFDGRDVVQVYDNQGRLYTGLTSQARYDGAALQQRGRALYAGSLRQRRWDRGSATAWIGGTSSMGYYDGWNSGWSGAWRELPEWDRYDRDHRHRHPPRHLDDEHRDRDDARRRYDDWHRRGGQGAPPPTGNPVVTPGDGTSTAPPPPRPPRPALQPQPQPQPPLTEPPQPVTETPPPVPSDAPTPRRERPRREIEDEPGMPPAPQRRNRPPPEQPVTQVQAVPVEPAQTWPDPMPGPTLPRPVLEPAPAPVPMPAGEPAYVPTLPEPVYAPPAPVPVPAPVAVPAPTPAPAPPPPPPPPPPPREQIQTESPPIDTDQP